MRGRASLARKTRMDAEGTKDTIPQEGSRITQENSDGTQQAVVVKKKRRIAIDYIIDKNYDNEYIQSWLGMPFVNIIREDPNFHSFLNHNELKKEITESFAVFVRVQQIIKRLYSSYCTANTTIPQLDFKQ